MAVAALGAMLSGVTAQTDSAEAANWVSYQPSCHTGGVSGWSSYRRCYQKQRLSGDTSTAYDFFATKMVIVAQATNRRWLKKTWIEAYPHPTVGARQTWHGYRPVAPHITVSDSGGPCTVRSFAVGGGPIPATLTEQTETCPQEHFGPVLYRDHGHHAGQWWADNCVAAGIAREAHQSQTVRVANYQHAQWASRYGAAVYSSRSSC